MSLDLIGYLGTAIWTLGSLSLAYSALTEKAIYVYDFFLKSWIIGCFLLIIHVLLQEQLDIPVLLSYTVDLTCALIVHKYNVR